MTEIEIKQFVNFKTKKMVASLTPAKAIYFSDRGRLDEEFNEHEERLDRLEYKTAPLDVEIISCNKGVFEVGDNVTPSIVLKITQNGVGVADLVNVEVSQDIASQKVKEGTDNTQYEIKGNALSAGSTSYTIKISQTYEEKERHVEIKDITYDFMNYIYYGEVDAIPYNYPKVIKGLDNKELSIRTTVSSQILNPNKYYLFACKGNIKFYCYVANTSMFIDGSESGTCIIGQENKGLTDISNEYSYILVPKSENTWTFDVTNTKM